MNAIDPIRLAVSTSTVEASVALAVHGDVHQRIFNKRDNPHCEIIMAEIQDLLESAGVSGDQICGVLVDHGPGSFTGLRIGIATANALGLGWNRPVAGISSLELLARRVQKEMSMTSNQLGVALHAGRGEAFVAVFHRTGNGWERQGPEKLYSGVQVQQLAAQMPVAGWQLERLQLKGPSLAPRAADCFELQPLLPAVREGFVQPNYLRLSDAQPMPKAN